MEVTSGSKVINQAIVLPDGVYEAIDGFELTEKWVEIINNKHLTRENVRYDQIWRFLAGDERLLEQYADAAFDIVEQFFNFEFNMGIVLNDLPEGVPTMRLMTIAGINQWSIAAGATDVDNTNSVLVGVTRETLEYLASGTIDSGNMQIPGRSFQGTLDELVRGGNNTNN
jgi:hypothetical protein|tara:strand:- start:318 stop:827 length:510 start_codon:yes stop_codon:yes gene_type:complete